MPKSPPNLPQSPPFFNPCSHEDLREEGEREKKIEGDRRREEENKQFQGERKKGPILVKIGGIRAIFGPIMVNCAFLAQ